jgi:hypothetical protein
MGVIVAASLALRKIGWFPCNPELAHDAVHRAAAEAGVAVLDE